MVYTIGDRPVDQARAVQAGPRSSRQVDPARAFARRQETSTLSLVALPAERHEGLPLRNAALLQTSTQHFRYRIPDHLPQERRNSIPNLLGNGVTVSAGEPKVIVE